VALTDDQREWLTLALVPGVGTTLFVKLLARFHTPHDVLRSSEADWRTSLGPSSHSGSEITSDVVDIASRSACSRCTTRRLLTMDDPAYPRACSRRFTIRRWCSSRVAICAISTSTPLQSSGRARHRPMATASRSGSGMNSRRAASPW
jgi:hypothetical protein